MKPGKTLYWVKFVDQGDGQIIDNYVYAESITKLDEEFTDILEIKVVKGVWEL